MTTSGNWISVAKLADLAEGSATAVDTMGLQLAVYRLQGEEVHVTDNICTHAFALLTDGWFEGHLIECPLHAGQFDVRTGHGQGAPIEEDIRVYVTRIVAGEVQIELPG